MPFSNGYRAGSDRLRPRLRGFGRSEEGATAVEFGLIAMPFFALLWSIIETALAFWAQQVLDTAVASASRQLYTNQFSSTYSAATAKAEAEHKEPPSDREVFKKLICGNVAGLLDCNKLDVDVRSLANGSFADAASAFRVPITDGAYDTSGYGFTRPGTNQICVVRASMEYPRFTSIASPSASLRNGNRLLLATFAFRAEPF
jgi:Flp pilus assembly protein TadG